MDYSSVLIYQAANPKKLQQNKESTVIFFCVKLKLEMNEWERERERPESADSEMRRKGVEEKISSVKEHHNSGAP